MTNTTKITLSLTENDVLDLLALISTQIDDEHFAWAALRDEIKRQALGAEERYAGLLISAGRRKEGTQ